MMVAVADIDLAVADIDMAAADTGMAVAGTELAAADTLDHYSHMLRRPAFFPFSPRC